MWTPEPANDNKSSGVALVWLTFHYGKPVYWICEKYVLVSLPCPLSCCGQPGGLLDGLYPSGVCGFCRCGHSPVFRCREMSGRALVPFLVATEVPHTALTLLRGLPDSAAPGMRQNAVHGTLLQVSLFCIHLFLFCEGFKFFFYCWGFLKKFLVILDSQITYHELCLTFTRCQNIDEGCFWVYSVRW